MCLPQTFDKYVSQRFLGNQRVNGERVEEVGIELNNSDHLTIIIVTLLYFDEDAFPNFREIYRLDAE